MIFELWSRRRKRMNWMSWESFLKKLPDEERQAIDADVKATLAARKYRVRTMIWTRTSSYWRPRFASRRNISSLRRRAKARLREAAEWRRHPKRRPTRLLRSKGWGIRACPHLFGRDCLGAWKSWLRGDGNRIVTSLAGREVLQQQEKGAP